MPKNKGGRPTVMTDLVIQKLEQAFTYGYSDAQACLHADISTSTLYNYCEKHPEFLERKAVLKDQPKMLARKNIYDSLAEGSTHTSQWYLERRDKDFKPKQDVDMAMTVQERLIAEYAKDADSTA